MLDDRERNADLSDLLPDARLAAARLASGLWAGLLAGLIIGGIGGRLAMFVLRLTSDASLHGMKTDDGFTIGSFTGSTMFLVAVTTAAGLVGGIFYLLVRRWIPQRTRPLAMGALAAAVGGAFVIRPDGIDFTLLEPLPLAIAMFIALPAAYGVATSWLTENLLRSAAKRSRRGIVLVLLPLLPIALAGPLGLLIIILLMAVWTAGWIIDRYVPLTAVWRSPAVTWIGRAGLAGLFIYASVGLITDSVEILR